MECIKVVGSWDGFLRVSGPVEPHEVIPCGGRSGSIGEWARCRRGQRCGRTGPAAFDDVFRNHDRAASEHEPDRIKGLREERAFANE